WFGAAAEGAVDGRPRAALRGYHAGSANDGEPARVHAPGGMVHEAAAGGDGRDPAHERRGSRRLAFARHRLSRPAAANPGARARSGKVLVAIRRPRAVEVAPRPSIGGRGGRTRGASDVRAGRVEHGTFRGKLKLARSDLDAGQLPARRGAQGLSP